MVSPSSISISAGVEAGLRRLPSKTNRTCGRRKRRWGGAVKTQGHLDNSRV